MSRIQRIARRASERRVPGPDAVWLPWSVYREVCAPHQRGRLQSTVCLRTGAVWVKPLTGKYAHLDFSELVERRSLLAEQVRALGGGCSFPSSEDLHYTVEYLENIIEWEHRPACGCEPDHGLSVACA